MLHITGQATEATLSGVTGGSVWADVLSPDCVGFLDPEHPNHVIRIEESDPVVISARSDRGPIAMVVRTGSTYVCDGSPESRHNPAVTLRGPGTYEVHVAALDQPSNRPYTVYLEPQRPVVVTVSE